MSDVRKDAAEGAILFVNAEPKITITDGTAIISFPIDGLAIRLPLAQYRRAQDAGDEAIAIHDQGG